MDGRFLLNNRQVDHLVGEDLPFVARCLTAALRGRARVAPDYVNSVSVIHMVGEGFDLYIRGDDWVKLLPHLVDGSLSPLTTAVARRTNPLDYKWEPGDLDLKDSDLYTRVLGLLRTLFTQSNPRSNL